MRRANNNTSNVIQTNKRAVLVSLIIVFTFVATLSLCWPFSSQTFDDYNGNNHDNDDDDNDSSHFYFDFEIDAHTVDTLSNHNLRINPPSDGCSCHQNSYISMEKHINNSISGYDIYLVTKIFILIIFFKLSFCFILFKID